LIPIRAEPRILICTVSGNPERMGRLSEEDRPNGKERSKKHKKDKHRSRDRSRDRKASADAEPPGRDRRKEEKARILLV
jgi:hypothetical protein